jgi:ABC-type amino acid transport system permease subunit
MSFFWKSVGVLAVIAILTLVAYVYFKNNIMNNTIDNLTRSDVEEPDIFIDSTSTRTSDISQTEVVMEGYDSDEEEEEIENLTTKRASLYRDSDMLVLDVSDESL